MAGEIQRIEDAFIKADEAGDTEAARLLYEEMQKMQAAEQIPTQGKPAGPDTTTAGQSFMTGVQDPLYGSAQAMAHVAPPWLESFGNEMTDMIDRMFGQPQRPGVTASQLDQNLVQREQEYQQARGAEGGSFDPWRLGGNVAGTLPLAMAVPGATAPGLAARTSASMLGGGLTAATQPVLGSNNYGRSKLGQIGLGMAGGGLTTGGLGVAGKAWNASPVSQSVKALWNEGIPTTIGQTLGGGARVLESKASSIPFVGGLIRRGEKKGLDAFRRALMNRALRPVGQKLSKNADAARGGIREVYNKVNAAYNRAVPKAGVGLDDVFDRRMGNLVTLAQNMEPGRTKQFMNILQSELQHRVSPNGHLTGDSAKAAISELRRQAFGFGKSMDMDQRQLGDALKQAAEEISNLIARQHPQIARQIKAADKSYGLLLQLEKAGSYIGANKGEFTPAMYLRAVQAMDSSMRKRAFSHGLARDQKFAEAAKDVLAPKYPDSGTAGRNMLGGYFGGAAGLGYGASQGYVPHALAAAGILGPPAAALGYGAANMLGPAAMRNMPQAGRYLAPGLAAGGGLLGGTAGQ